MTIRNALASLVVVSAALTACSSNDATPPDVNASLAPAREVEAGAAVKMGEFVDLGIGVRVQVSGPQVGGSDAGPWLEVPLRVENAGDAEAYVPSFSIFCANTDKGGSFQEGGSIDVSDPIPAGSFQDGTLHLLLPGDARTGETVPRCEGPAYIEAELSGFRPAGSVPGRWALDAAAVASLNAGLK